jgi:hypothetical protein
MSALALAGRATGCICGKEMVDRNDGWCFWCGHGVPSRGVDEAYRRVMERSEHPEFAGPSRVVVPLVRSNTWSEDECVAAYYAWRANHGREPTSSDWQQPAGLDRRPSYGTVYKLFGGWEGFKRHIAEIPRDQVGTLA